MRSTLATVLALVGTSHALPVATLSSFTDVDILNYALTLEHLEDKFYREALANFTQADFAAAGYDSTFYTNLNETSNDEVTHVAFLTNALMAVGAVPVKECSYAFGVTDVASFVATASIFEGIGVAAYLGAAAQIATKAYLSAAGSVLSVEARHSSYIRASLMQSPFPQPFEAPLSPNEVYTLAAPFITACPEDNPTFPVKAYPSLAVTSTGSITTGSEITISSAPIVLQAANDQVQIYASFAAVTGPIWAPLEPVGTDGVQYSVTIPDGVFGQSYLRLSNCNDTTALTDRQILAGPALVEIAKA